MAMTDDKDSCTRNQCAPFNFTFFIVTSNYSAPTPLMAKGILLNRARGRALRSDTDRPARYLHGLPGSGVRSSAAIIISITVPTFQVPNFGSVFMGRPSRRSVDGEQFCKNTATQACAHQRHGHSASDTGSVVFCAKMLNRHCDR